MSLKKKFTSKKHIDQDHQLEKTVCNNRTGRDTREGQTIERYNSITGKTSSTAQSPTDLLYFIDFDKS